MGKLNPQHGRPRDRGWYLKYAKAESFGGLNQTVLGPLTPGLNVVHGVNEAGKTTFAHLISGVMFGWEDGRSAVNTYKPENAERSAALTFARVDDATEKIARMKRVRNADGLQGDRWLLDDVDQETYAEIFSLNSDQLRGMGDAGQVTSRLLTASAGTSMSPALAREVIESRIATYTSRSMKCPHSITQLTEQRDRLAAQLAEAQEEAAQLEQDDAALVELKAERERLQEQTRANNMRIERLTQAQTVVETQDERMRALQNEIEALDIAADSADALSGYDDVPKRLVKASAAERAAFHDRLDRLGEEESRVWANVDQTRTSYESMLGEYEGKFAASRAAEARDTSTHQTHKITFVQIALFAIAAIVFAALGVYVAIAGGENVGLPMMGLFAGALVFAVIAVVSAIFGLSGARKASDAEGLEEAEWLMDKERRRYEAAQAAEDVFAQKVRIQLEAMGAVDLEGGLRAARMLLDRADQANDELDANKKAKEAIEARRTALEKELNACGKARAESMEACWLQADNGTVELDIALHSELERREDLATQLEALNTRIGQIEQRLEAARDKRDLDLLRMEHQQVLTRLRESQRGLAQALLARRALDAAIEEWKGSSQPEVYQAAGRLLSRMTGGRWCHVTVDDDGQIMVSDKLGEPRSPLLLSTGTVQQLYLALRIALLDTAEFVGRNVPVICDDILVNFDEKRRRAAAKALARLARNRQVILFTCHKDVVMSLRAADLSVNVIDL